MNSLYECEVRTLEGQTRSLESFRGKVLLIVNVASKCGFTSQYAGLESLYKRLQPQGLEVLGFPCNQFRNQEPGSADDIRKFCSLTYEVTFPLFDKIDVNGDNTHPLYTYLKDRAPGILGTKSIKWNFTKFLVDKSGNVVQRFAPMTSIDSVEREVSKLL